MNSHPLRFAALALLATALAADLQGCGIKRWITGGGASHGNLTVRSDPSQERAEHTILPNVRTAVYSFSDSNTIDIYLTDLAEGDLSHAADQPANLIHLHVFLNPKAGRTPIDATACNATVQHLIVTGPGADGRVQAGIYGGGGFILPSSSAGASKYTASLKDMTVRLTRASDGFHDLLDVATMSGRITARRDARTARRIGDLIESMSRTLPRVMEADEAPASEVEPEEQPGETPAQ